MEVIRLCISAVDVLDHYMKSANIKKDFRHKAIRGILNGIVYSVSLYGLYLKHIKRDTKFREDHPLSDIPGFRPVPFLFDGEAYTIIGTDAVLVVNDKGHNFLRVSYDLDEDFITLVTLEHLLEELPEDVAEVIIFNLDKLDR